MRGADAGRRVLVNLRGVRIPLALARVGALADFVLVAERVSRALLGIEFVSTRAISKLHRELLGTGGVTDVVTMELDRSAPGAPAGGVIYISPEVARRHAHDFGVGVRDEICRLVVHGVLHSLGWEHPENGDRERSEMWRRQESLLRRARRAGVI